MIHPQITRLNNGLRVATSAMAQLESVSIGMWIGAGSRHEPAPLNGITHFIEHLLFKGTRHRSAKQISQEVEGVGGYINAFTAEENTCFYAQASHRHLDRLLNVLADMYLNPLLARGDIRKERAVIKEELLMYRDQPQQFVQEMLTETLWPRHPLGRAVAGTPETIDAFNRANIHQYLRTRFTASNTIIAAAGHCEHDDIVERVRRIFPLKPDGGAPRFQPARIAQRRPRLKMMTKESEQTHIAIGFRGISRHDPRRYALRLMSVMLGESMSSRLFQVVREQHGLAYAIQSATSYFADTGALYISAGLDNRRLPKALKLIVGELKKLTTKPPSAAELRRTKDYSIGQMWMGLESSTNQMMWLGEHLLAYGRIEAPTTIEERVQEITADDIRRIAQYVFANSRFNTAVIGPDKDDSRLVKLLRV